MREPTEDPHLHDDLDHHEHHDPAGLPPLSDSVAVRLDHVRLELAKYRVPTCGHVLERITEGGTVCLIHYHQPTLQCAECMRDHVLDQHTTTTDTGQPKLVCDLCDDEDEHPANHRFLPPVRGVVLRDDSAREHKLDAAVWVAACEWHEVALSAEAQGLKEAERARHAEQN